MNVHISRKTITLAIILVVIGSSMIQISGYQNIKIALRIIAYAPLESGASSLPAIASDLKAAQKLGFVGVKLWDAPGLLQARMLPSVIDEGSRIGLQFFIPILIENPSHFPYDHGAIQTTKSYLSSLIEITKTRSAVAYNIWMPYDFRNQSYVTVIRSAEYINGLTDLVNFIRNLDPSHRIFAFTDANPNLGFPARLNVDGFGVQPYSQIVDNLDQQRIQQYLSYFSGTGKPVYIDEWGMHTTSDINLGRASTATSKGRLTNQFFGLCDNLGIQACTYFLLVDSSLYPTDWGLLNDDRTLRLSPNF